MERDEISLRQGAAWGMIAFGVALAVMVGVRLEQAALAVVVGVACGVLAGIPTSLLIVAVMRRRDAMVERQDHSLETRAGRAFRQGADQAPVIVVAPPAAPQLPQPTTWSGGYVPTQSSQREFSVIGQEEEYELDYW